MVRLVVTWSSGDYECFSEHVACIEYASREDFLLDLQIKVEDYLKARQEYYDANKKWHEELRLYDPVHREAPARPSRNQLVLAKQEKKERERSEKWREVWSRQPQAPDDQAEFNGVWLELSTFLYNDHANGNYGFSDPEVLILDEWWNSKVAERKNRS